MDLYKFKGSHVEEVINIFAISIQLGLRATDIKQAIVTYPTKTSDISYMLQYIITHIYMFNAIAANKQATISYQIAVHGYSVTIIVPKTRY